jgi:ubiquinone/menaquinone biosynthesis C-methylase UbiE
LDEPTASPRKQAIKDAAERHAADAAVWRARNAYFHQEDARYQHFLIRSGLRVLELGCGTGELLASLQTSEGVGVDFSAATLDLARRAHPQLTFLEGDVEHLDRLDDLQGRVFDVVLLSDTIGSLEDVQYTLEQLHRFCTSDTRVIIAHYSRMWEPLLGLAEKCGLKTPTPLQNWLLTDDIVNIAALADFEEVKREWRQLLPKRAFGLGTLVNRFIATLPVVRRLCVRNYVVLRSRRLQPPAQRPSVSVIVPCRNERGNIEAAVTRTPRMGPDQEIIFVEGLSNDGTLAEIHRVIAQYPDLDIQVAQQDGKGKGDAVRKGFDTAKGEVLMILDADLTMPPEDLPKFYNVIASGRAEFANGSRLVYPMEDEAMRNLNLFANHIFAKLFTYILNQRFTDTLCGTKALARKHYRQIAASRGYFGNFDPFGDFDLIFGASKLNLKSVEVPIRYRARTYGTTQIQRFRHGLLLLRMVVFAWWKLKAI